MASYQDAEAPPSYDQATDPSAAPPSYDSLYREFREVESPTSFFKFFMVAVNFVIGTAIATCCLAIANIVPIAMVIIGGMNINNCPVEPWIPIWLIVMGCCSIGKSVLNILYRAKRRFIDEDVNDPHANVKPNPFDGLISMFLLAWFIAGCVWVYRTPTPSSVPGGTLYCDSTTYQFAYWLLLITFIIVGLIMTCTCCCGCCAVCFGKRREGGGRH